MAKVVAVIGASADRRKYGNKALRAFRQQGYDAIPVNPHESEIEGLKTFGSVLDIPGPVDMATLYVQPEVGAKVLEEIARKQIGEVWLNPGADHPSVVSRAKALGIQPIIACSILGIGDTPSRY
jgi:predicted CoA-binding protein